MLLYLRKGLHPDTRIEIGTPRPLFPTCNFVDPFPMLLRSGVGPRFQPSISAPIALPLEVVAAEAKGEAVVNCVNNSVHSEPCHGELNLQSASGSRLEPGRFTLLDGYSRPKAPRIRSPSPNPYEARGVSQVVVASSATVPLEHDVPPPPCGTGGGIFPCCVLKSFASFAMRSSARGAGKTATANVIGVSIAIFLLSLGACAALMTVSLSHRHLKNIRPLKPPTHSPLRHANKSMIVLAVWAACTVYLASLASLLRHRLGHISD